MATPRPLDGITVVAIEHAIAAPFCTRQLADLGARVIKVERPGTGDFARQYDSRVNGLASHFVWTNRSKESIALDLKDPEAREVLGELVSRADVLVQNLAPGAAGRLGLGYDLLSAKHPRLIVCDISGYGNSGPYVDKKAYDLLIQSESGFMSVTGTAEEPCKAGVSISDISAGMYAYSSILAALLQRGRTGLGSHIDVSLFEASVEWMSFPLYYAYEGAAPPLRTGAAHATIYPYGPFRTGGGGQVMLGLQNEREWVIFCEQVLCEPRWLEDEEFSSNARRVAARARLESIILDAFARLDAAEVVARLDAAGIANARINTVAEVWSHPQLAARDRWSEVSTSAGRVPALKPPAMLTGTQARMDPVPGLGEHTASILRELGSSRERVERLCGAQTRGMTEMGHGSARSSPRPAATLILARTSDAGPEILLMKRSSRASFMPNAYVFAGGMVDAADADPAAYALSRHLDDRQASGILDVPAQGLAFYVAAVRETFEECGMMLAYDDAGKLVNLAAWTDAQLCRARVDLGSGAGGLVELCRRHGWHLALDQLHYFAHWVTPVGLPQRFDTRFFIARAPVEQRASLASDEMSELIWRTPGLALRDHAEGRLLLMRATLASLREIATFSDIDALFEFASTPRKISVVRPVIGEELPPPN